MVHVVLRFHVKSFLLYVSTSPQYVCSAQCCCFLQVPDLALAQYVAELLSDFEMVPVAPTIVGIAFGFYIPHALNLYYYYYYYYYSCVCSMLLVCSLVFLCCTLFVIGHLADDTILENKN